VAVRKVLVVDDSASSRELLLHVLKGTCEEVLEAADGWEALEKIAAAKPDLVLLDLEMPRMDGYEVLRQMRCAPDFAGTRVVAVTARAMQNDRDRALAAGFDGYFTKPVNVSELRAYVRGIEER
jgi:CheY-like chemotaxis protein